MDLTVDIPALRFNCTFNNRGAKMRAALTCVIVLMTAIATAEELKMRLTITSHLTEEKATVVIKTAFGKNETKYVLGPGETRSWKFDEFPLIEFFDENNRLCGSNRLYATEEWVLKEFATASGAKRWSNFRNEDLHKRPAAEQKLRLPDDWPELEFTDEQKKQLQEVSNKYQPRLKPLDDLYLPKTKRLATVNKSIEDMHSRGLMNHKLDRLETDKKVLTQVLARIESDRNTLLAEMKNEMLPILTKQQLNSLDAVACKRMIGEDLRDLDVSDEQWAELYLTMKSALPALDDLDKKIKVHEAAEAYAKRRIKLIVEGGQANNPAALEWVDALDKIREDKADLEKQREPYLNEVRIAIDEVLTDKQKRMLYAKMPQLRRDNAPKRDKAKAGGE